MAAQAVSLTRLRLGILFFVLWWVPLYLMAPLIAGLFATNADSHAVANVTLIIVIVQTILGIVGVWLAGKELIGTLRQVRFRRMPVVIWHITRTGHAGLEDGDLKKQKVANQA